MTRKLPPHLAAIAPKDAHVADTAAERNESGVLPLAGTGFRREFVIPRTVPIMVRDSTTADWADIWPFFRALIAAGETICLPNLMMGSDARTLWYGGADTEVVVAVDPRDKPQIENPDTPILGRIVGSASMRTARDGHGNHVLHADFVVDPRLAAQGVEQELGISVLTKAQAAGFRAVEIDPVVETDSAAIEAWTQLGFRRVGTRPAAFEHPVDGFVALHTFYRQVRGGDAA